MWTRTFSGVAGDDGPIRRALTGLLDAWLDLDRSGFELLERVRTEAGRAARAVSAARPSGAALAEQVTSQLPAGTTAAGHEFGGLAQVFADEARALVQLLTGSPGVVTAAPLGSGPEAVVAAFPEGDGRDYVGGMVADAAAEVRQSSEAAERVPAGDAIALSVAAGLREEFDEAVREDILAMVCHPRGHAVQLHGPDVPDEALIARVTWKKDPMGRADAKNAWRRDADGAVQSRHGIGHVAGRFTSIAALAKPLKALLAHCGGTMEGLGDYLDLHGPDGRARIFVTATDAGLVPGDTTGFRGAGTSNDTMAEHWREARRDAMTNGGGPMPVVRTDQIADNDDAGAAMILRKIDGRWMLVTCFATSVQDDGFIRLGAEA